jgi:hypothetical protein
MLIKIDFVTENINYTEINTETLSGAGWNINTDLKHVQMFILPGGPVFGYQYCFVAVAASVSKILHHSYRSHF